MAQIPKHTVTGTDSSSNPVYREVVAVVNLDGSAMSGSGSTGGLTNTELRAAALPVSATSLPLPAGAATEETLSAQSAKLPATLGQKTKTASLAVTIASDQDTLKTADQAGAGAMQYLTTTSPATGSWSYIQVITDTVFATLTNANASTPGTLATLTIPAGTVLRGAFTAVALTSGAVALYV